PFDGDGAGDVTARVAAHTVGYDEEAFAGVGGVLVVGADLPDVGEGGTLSGAGHRLPPQLETGGADAHGGSDGYWGGYGDAVVVEECAVGGVEVLDDPPVVPLQKFGVVGGGVVVAD